MTIKEMLNKIMEKRRIDQQGLALLLRVDKAQVSRWLNEAVPKIENQRKIKKLYDEVINENNKRIVQ